MLTTVYACRGHVITAVKPLTRASRASVGVQADTPEHTVKQVRSIDNATSYSLINEMR